LLQGGAEGRKVSRKFLCSVVVPKVSCNFLCSTVVVVVMVEKVHVISLLGVEWSVRGCCWGATSCSIPLNECIAVELNKMICYLIVSWWFVVGFRVQKKGFSGGFLSAHDFSGNLIIRFACRRKPS
jgi:hypothetical protein